MQQSRPASLRPFAPEGEVLPALAELSSALTGLPGRLVGGLDTEPRGTVMRAGAHQWGSQDKCQLPLKGAGPPADLRRAQVGNLTAVLPGVGGLHSALRVSEAGCGVMCLLFVVKKLLI